MSRETAGQFFIERERLVIAADAAERRGAKVRMRRVVGIVAEHRIERLCRFGKAVLLVIDGREIGPRGPESRRELQRARQ